MKKVALFLSIVLFAVSAQARVPFRPKDPKSGIYLGLKGGGTYAKIKTPWTDESDDKKEKSGTFAMAASLGVRIRYFRLEAEYMMMNKQKSAGSYQQDVDTVMGQLYFDLPFRSPIKPFVNVGAGLYTIDFKKKHEWSDDDRAFAWNAGGGLTWAISSLTNLDLGYRYLDLGDLKTPGGKIRQDNHVFYIGWRHVF